MIDYKIYNTVNELSQSWDDLVGDDIFLKRLFLRALEQSCPKNITPYYISIFKTEKNIENLVGIIIIQRVEMYLDDIFRNSNDKYLIRKSKQVVSKIVRGNALIIGNIMHTGQHGLFFNAKEINHSEYLKQVSKAIKSIQKELKEKHNKKVRIIAFKDYFEDDAIHLNQGFFKNHNFYKVQVQPNMIFTIPNEWKTNEDYVSAFSKKYRDRYKSAIKKAKTITKKELNLENITRLQSQLFHLYKNVSDNARVNSFVLNDTHFVHLKKELGENFRVFGYFLNEELVGFYTLILNAKKLETYFLGYNDNLQRKHQLYLNMLYDMAAFGIKNNFGSIVYARTAIEIKSSIGAKPKLMHIYMKHTNNFPANIMLRFIVKYLNPTREWVERQPFKY